MSARRLAALVAVLAVALAPGCLKRSKVARTYVLDPMSAATVAAPPSPLAVVGVERVSVPDWLDRPQITGRATNGEVVTDEFSRWGEPLPRGVQRVVAENLARLLPDRHVVVAPFAPRDHVDYGVEITVVDAGRQADASVLLDTRWTIRAKDGTVLVRRRSSHRAGPTVLGPAGAVAGMNEALESLSRELAEALRGLPAASEQSPGSESGGGHAVSELLDGQMSSRTRSSA